MRLLLVGLAPGLQGANRTGRPFTGDGCGPLLYNTLKKYGFARGSYQARPDDGLQLVEMAIANAVRCVPPENKPLGAEISTCRRYLAPYLQGLPRLHVVVTLGKVAHESTLRALGVPLKAAPFIHGRMVEIRRAGVTQADSNGGVVQVDSGEMRQIDKDKAQFDRPMIQAGHNGSAAPVKRGSGSMVEGSDSGSSIGSGGGMVRESGRGESTAISDSRLAPIGSLRLISSYHCSRYNTSTGRLTEAMFHEIFATARQYLDSMKA
ncbi:uracil-DNA glycosylase family protein [Candidatus Tokpelaia sp.]|uniref:uracil-DNA glycosylase family protein n=1 Tax=Candidatus Tokpelaia sp. TaxID=2233777 RepID=UPI0030B98F38